MADGASVADTSPRLLCWRDIVHARTDESDQANQSMTISAPATSTLVRQAGFFLVLYQSPSESVEIVIFSVETPM